jgi:hypothetical protein
VQVGVDLIRILAHLRRCSRGGCRVSARDTAGGNALYQYIFQYQKTRESRYQSGHRRRIAGEVGRPRVSANPSGTPLPNTPNSPSATSSLRRPLPTVTRTLQAYAYAPRSRGANAPIPVRSGRLYVAPSPRPNLSELINLCSSLRTRSGELQPSAYPFDRRKRPKLRQGAIANRSGILGPQIHHLSGNC